MTLSVGLTREPGGAYAALKGVCFSSVVVTGEPQKVCE